MMFQNSQASERECLSCAPLKHPSPRMVELLLYCWLVCVPQLLFPVFLLNLFLSTMSTLHKIVFNLNATCCVMSVK